MLGHESKQYIIFFPPLSIEIHSRAVCWKTVMILWFGFVIFSVPLVASRHNIPQRRKILPKNIPWSVPDFKIVLSVIEKKICRK